LCLATDHRSLAASHRAIARAPNHAPQSPVWQIGCFEINAAFRPAGKIGKGRAVPALCYGTAKKPEKKLKPGRRASKRIIIRNCQKSTLRCKRFSEQSFKMKL
jgi:hypothetical protein